MSEYAAGDRLEVWLAGWDRWFPGVVVQTGRLGGMDCVAVQFPDSPCPSIYRFDQVRRLDKTLTGPIGGLFSGGLFAEEAA